MHHVYYKILLLVYLLNVFYRAPNIDEWPSQDDVKDQLIRSAVALNLAGDNSTNTDYDMGPQPSSSKSSQIGNLIFICQVSLVKPIHYSQYCIPFLCYSVLNILH